MSTTRRCLVILLTYFTTFGNALQYQDLGGLWTLNSNSSEFENLRAIVPGGIYSDLMNNKIIPDVFSGYNDVETRWVATKEWTYSRSFDVNATLLSHEYVNLMLDGVDTFSEIIINNKTIGKTDNMFVRYEFDIKGALKLGQNEISIKFESPINRAQELYDEQLKSYLVPPVCVPSSYNGECHVNHIRKMQASFSWDWGPAFPSVGIWKRIYVESYNSSLIRDVTFRTVKKDDTYEWELYLKVYFAKNINAVKGNVIVKLFNDLDQITFPFQVTATKDEENDYVSEHLIKFPQGDVKLWWPNGYGDQNLYVIKVTYINEEQNEQCTKRFKIGFRTVELIQDELLENNTTLGREFKFKINDKIIFAKGANVIPVNILPERENVTTIRFLLESAKSVNMNMLRVWGGGMYESDDFYSIADELGLLIWQDLMFACSMYPTNEEYLATVKEEVKHQVRRLQYHPSIVIWAGNNENEGALRQNWYGTAGNFTLYKSDYVKLYVDLMKTTVLKYDEGREYLVSSPTNGIESELEGYVASNPQSNFYGDIHYYNYIQDGWNKNVFPKPRFSSEYGYQSLPAKRSWLKATNTTDSTFLKHRQHHPGGYLQMKWLLTYQLNMPGENSSSYFDAFIYNSQLYQAMAIKAETEHYRSFMGLQTPEGVGWTYGALYWQLNDVWVAPTWASIDFEQNWKMLHYYAKDFFAPTIITGHLQTDRSLDIYVINELAPYYNATILLNVYNWQSFNVTSRVIQKVDIPSGVSTKVNFGISEVDLFLASAGCGTIATAKLNCFIQLEVQDSNQKAIAPFNYVIPSALKTLNFVKNNTNVKISSVYAINKKEFELEIDTNSIALFVWLECDFKGTFSENGFIQIVPKKSISFTSLDDNVTLDQFLKSLTITHLLGQ